jgi:hypothetical protein
VIPAGKRECHVAKTLFVRLKARPALPQNRNLLIRRLKNQARFLQVFLGRGGTFFGVAKPDVTGMINQ